MKRVAKPCDEVRAPGSAGGQPTCLSGTIEPGQLHIVLGLLGRARRTGVLKLKRGMTSASLTVYEGRILDAHSTLMPKLGEILLQEGKLRADQLDAVLWVQRQDTVWQSLGSLLVQVGLLSREAARSLVGAQILMVLSEVLKWTDGTFRFEESAVAAPLTAVADQQEIAQVLLEVAKLEFGAPDGEPPA